MHVTFPQGGKRINPEATAEIEYDAVIVGGGISGAIIAKQLSEAGKHVVIIDAGLAEDLTLRGYEGYLARFYSAVSKDNQSPYPNNPNAQMPRATDAQSLRDALAVSIPDAIARDAFVRAQSLSRPLSMSLSRPSSASAASGGSGASGMSGISGISAISGATTRSAVSSPSQLRSDSMKVLAVNAEQQAVLERALGQYLGPLAKTLVRREVARQPSFNTLLQALAEHIDKPDERARFLAVAGKLSGGGA